MKIIKILKCSQPCPYYYHYPGCTHAYCKNEYRYLPKTPKKIPKWCTLEDAEEEIKVAGYSAGLLELSKQDDKV